MYTIISLLDACVTRCVLSAYMNVYSPNSTWLVTSCLDTTRHARHVERVETSVSSRAVPTWRTKNKL